MKYYHQTTVSTQVCRGTKSGREKVRKENIRGGEWGGGQSGQHKLQAKFLL